MDPAATQRRQLARLVARAAATRFGRDHRFDEILDVADFQRRVPLRTYESMWGEYWRSAFPRLDGVSWPGRTPYFALSSGTTTGRTKYLPITGAMCRSNRRAGLDVLVHHLLARPRSRVFAGKNLMLGGSTALDNLAPGIVAGDLSGIAAKTLPHWARLFTLPDARTAVLADWAKKIERLADIAVSEDIRGLTGTPSWVLELLERVEARRGGDGPAFPHLALFVHGGVSFAPYRRLFARHFAGQDVDLREVYPASEGFVASADREPGLGLRLNLDHGLFFEFVPVEELASASPTRHWLATIETGVNYAIVLSSCAGLFAYVLGDTVRFVERRPPRLVVTGRTSQGLSAFGEHLIVEEIERSVAGAAALVGADVVDFAAGAIFSPRPRHVFVIEFAQDSVDGDRFGAALDAALAGGNDDYRSHRTAGVGLDAPEIRLLPSGGFAAWMKRRGKLGGQNKVPRTIADPALWQDLLDFTAEFGHQPKDAD